MEYKYFVTLQRLYQEEEHINILDREEAIKNHWIKEDGDRIWVVPPKEEKSPTYVWGFDDLDTAVNFYECLKHNELGIKCYEIF